METAAVTDILARAADEIITPRFGRLGREDIREKTSPTDLVTEVDVAVEAYLRDALKPITPEAGFIGEEGAAAEPGVVAAIEGEGAYWVADPLDGTRNFVHGKEEFATILALVRDGETEAGWIYAPPLRSCAVAVKGGGVSWAGRMVDVAPPAGDRPQGLRSTGWLGDADRDRILPRLKENVETRPGLCSAYAYLQLIRGETDFKLSSRIHPWDHAAGALMLTEAGGRVAFLEDGADYRPRDSIDAPLLAVAPGRDWDDIARRIYG